MEQKQRTAAYARVSSMTASQENSLIAQTGYYRQYIQDNPRYEFAGVYADQESGKNANNRKQFNLLLKACRNGDVEMIITKSIARFARNLVETLQIVIEMRQRGIGIIFEKESINSLDPSSDLKLSLYASFAENELESQSANIKWAARKRYQAGQVEFNLMYGYRYLGNKQHEIVPEEAEIVKEIFERYVNGEGTRKIAVSLNERGVKKKVGEKPWVSHDVLRVITSEKYTGDAILQKTVSEKFDKVKNNGQAPQYYVENNHPAIVTHEQFDKANEILKSRQWSRDSVHFQPKSPFVAKIICGCCGTTYLRRKHHGGSINRGTLAWECGRYASSGKQSCPGSRCFNEKEFLELFLSAYNEAATVRVAESKPARLDEVLKDLLAEERNLSALRAKGYISRDAYLEEQASLVAQIKATEDEYAETTKHEGGGMFKPVQRFSDGLVRQLEQAVMNDLKITFKFRNGVEIHRFFNSFRRKPLKQNPTEVN